MQKIKTDSDDRGPSKRLTVRLSNETIESIDEERSRRSMSRSELVRDAIDAYLNQPR